MASMPIVPDSKETLRQEELSLADALSLTILLHGNV